MSTSAGSPPRAASGIMTQSSQSAQSSMDMTRMIMERNAPRAAHSSGSATSAAAARAGTRSAGAAGGGLGAAAGPLGIAAMATAMAGSALESGGRWMAGQAATGGGVLGDVEAPAVPSPPISRVPHHGGARQSSGAQANGPAAPAATAQPANITIVQTQPDHPAHTALPSSGPHLVIPGTVLPDRDPAQLRGAPKALPPGKDVRHG